jgi:hypothetical protein
MVTRILSETSPYCRERESGRLSETAGLVDRLDGDLVSP